MKVLTSGVYGKKHAKFEELQRLFYQKKWIVKNSLFLHQHAKYV